jgi:hypothetical protein
MGRRGRRHTRNPDAGPGPRLLEREKIATAWKDRPPQTIVAAGFFMLAPTTSGNRFGSSVRRLPRKVSQRLAEEVHCKLDWPRSLIPAVYQSLRIAVLKRTDREKPESVLPFAERTTANMRRITHK